MPDITITVPVSVAARVLNAASSELGVDPAATQAEKVAAIKAHFRAILVGLVRKHEIDVGRVTGETDAIANLPDFTQIT